MEAVPSANESKPEAKIGIAIHSDINFNPEQPFCAKSSTKGLAQDSQNYTQENLIKREKSKINKSKIKKHKIPNESGKGMRRKKNGYNSFSRRLWNQEEDEAISKLVDKYGYKRWTLISKQLEVEYNIIGRTGKQCRER